MNDMRGSVPSIRIWTPAKVIQNILDFLTVMITSSEIYINPLQSLLVPAAMSAGLRTPGTPWKDRSVTMWTQNASEPHGNAWSFLFHEAGLFSKVANKYAFAKILPDGKGVQTFDIRGFLVEMEKEGRKPLPSPDLVLEFEDLVAKSSDEKTQPLRRPFRTTLFDDDDSAAKFMTTVLAGPLALFGNRRRG